MHKVKIQLINERPFAKMPERATKDASGLDAYASEIEIRSDELIIYKLGFKTEMPPHIEGLIMARSGLTNHPFVIPNGVGLVDSDYRGEWQFRIRCLRDETGDIRIPYDIGERCCQIKLQEKFMPELEQVEDLSDTERGEGGFGHTKNK